MWESMCMKNRIPLSTDPGMFECRCVCEPALWPEKQTCRQSDRHQAKLCHQCLLNRAVITAQSCHVAVTRSLRVTHTPHQHTSPPCRHDNAHYGPFLKVFLCSLILMRVGYLIINLKAHCYSNFSHIVSASCWHHGHQSGSLMFYAKQENNRKTIISGGFQRYHQNNGE